MSTVDLKKQLFGWCLTFAILGSATTAASAQSLGSPQSKKGGVIYLNIPSDPDSLHPIMSSDAYAQELHNYTFSGLASVRPDTYEMEPALAEKWDIAKDGKTITFYLREGLKFHDGKPITPEDVKFSFDAIFKEEFKAFHSRPYFENIESATVESPNKIVFKIKKVYFNNFNVLASGGFMPILPKHVYEKFDRKQHRTIVGSGPYKFVSADRGKSVILERHKDWGLANIPYYQHMFNPDRIFFRIVKDDNLVIENMKRGLIDFYGLNAEQFMQKTNDKAFTDKMVKVKTENRGPAGYGFIAWNLKNPLFKEKEVRRALAHLMNRELMVSRFLFDLSVPATGPWHYKSPYASTKVKPIRFDPKEAAKLLKKVGWEDTDKDGLLDKDNGGKKTPFKFTLIYSNRDFEKYYTLYKEDLKKSGIEMELKLLEWNSFLKLVTEGKFEATSLGWSGGSVDIDPKQIWHSESDRAGGHNFIGYKNASVDKLIDQARVEMAREKRIPILQKAFEQIAEDAPYLFLFNSKNTLYAHSKRVQKTKDTYTYSVGNNYWWLSDAK